MLHLEVYMMLGSNQGDSLNILKDSVGFIGRSIGEVKKRSLVYYTEPWGNKNQSYFFNQAVTVSVKNDLNCKKNFHEICKNIFQNIQEIEKHFGRKRIEKWGARTLDIDILFINDHIINNEYINIPHIEIANRKFVLTPLNEIASDFKHPILQKTIKVLLEECPDKSEVKVWKDL